jgi:hypothetical protein
MPSMCMCVFPVYLSANIKEVKLVYSTGYMEVLTVTLTGVLCNRWSYWNQKNLTFKNPASLI